MEVDLVYTWVDGNDPDYLRTYNQYATIPKDINPERTRDTYNMLKYSLRSVEQYLTWIRNIYIVTARPQKPEWLNIDHPQINVIHHDEIIDPQYLPTFNYNTIESYMHKIPGLSEYYLYSCDDFLFGSPVYLKDYIDEDGRITVFGSFFGENLKFRIYERKNDIVPIGLVEHQPLFFKKSYVEDLQNHYQDLFHESRLTKFRRGSNVTMQKVYKQWMLTHHPDKSKAIKLKQLLKIHTFHKIKNNYKKQVKALSKLKNKAPKFFCLNDDQRDPQNPKVIELVRNFLEQQYPKKSEFEI